MPKKTTRLLGTAAAIGALAIMATTAQAQERVR
jgi:hypothetical protein